MCSRRSARTRRVTVDRRGAERHRARRLSRRRVVRRDVHGEHDGRGRRGDRHVAARQRLAARGRLPPRGVRTRERDPSRAARRRGRSAAPRHPHAEAFENAIAVVMAVAGSTNAVLHLLAIAREAHVDLQLEDFDRIGRAVPHLVNVRPAGRFVMSDIDRVGGVQVVIKELLEAGLVDGDVMTVTGSSLADNIAAMEVAAPDGDVVHPSSDPIHPWGGLAILSWQPRAGRRGRQSGGRRSARCSRGPRTPVRFREGGLRRVDARAVWCRATSW